MNAADFRTSGGANLTDSVNGVTYLFTVLAESASRNCSGDVVSIQYCYRARDGVRDDTSIFNLLAVDRNGLQFTIISSTTIQTTPQDSICTDPQAGNIDQICCDTTPLSGFQIPSSEYTFGIVITNEDVRPLAFVDSVTEYRIEYFIKDLGARPTPGNTITLTDRDRFSNSTMLLMRFVLGNDTTSMHEVRYISI